MEQQLEPQQQQGLEKTPVPPYEAWPSVPRGTPDVQTQREKSNAMDLDIMMSPEDRHSRATSGLSMDDIEAAQALEGLRAGTWFSQMRLQTLLQSFLQTLLQTLKELILKPSFRLHTVTDSVRDPLARHPYTAPCERLVSAGTAAFSDQLPASATVDSHQRVSFRLFVFEVVFPTLQIRRRICRAKYRVAGCEYCGDRGSYKRSGNRSPVVAATDRLERNAGWQQ